METKTYQTYVGGDGDLFLHVVVNGMDDGLPRAGETVLIERTSRPIGDKPHLIRVSGIEMVRALEILPGYKMRVRRHRREDHGSFEVSMDDSSVRVIGVYHGMIFTQQGRPATDTFGHPTTAIRRAQEAGLI